MKLKVLWPIPDKSSVEKASKDLPTSLVGQNVEVSYEGTRAGPDTIQNPYDLTLEELSVLDACKNAEKEGFDGVLIDSVGDYALTPLRSRLSIPVMGAGIIAMLVACMLGRKFSIVTVWPDSFRFVYEKLLDEYKLRDKCASIRTVASSLVTISKDWDGTIGLMRERNQTVLKRIEEECLRAVKEDGADAIVLGCTCMAPAYDYLRERIPVPVVNSKIVAYKITELLVQLGLAQSKRAYPTPEHPKDELLQLG